MLQSGVCHVMYAGSRGQCIVVWMDINNFNLLNMSYYSTSSAILCIYFKIHTGIEMLCFDLNLLKAWIFNF